MFPQPGSTPQRPPSNGRPTGLDKVGTVLTLAADAVLYHHGESADSLYYVDLGAVGISVAAADGEQILLTVHGAGTFFGARSLGQERHNATASALLPSTLVRVSKGAVRDLLRTEPAFARQFALHMMQRVASLEEDQIDRAVNSIEKRLARALLILAGVHASSDGAPVLKRITETGLAHILAAEPGRIRELLQEFRRAGHLEPGEPLSVHSSLVRVLLPAHLAEVPSPLDELTRP